MRNLDILKIIQFSLETEQNWIMMAIDTLTPEVYFAHTNGFISTSFDGKVSYSTHIEGLTQ